MEACECTHEHTREEVTQSAHCRHVPSTWEREDDDDPFETVTVTDRAVYCDDCGELLDYSAGD